jgi:hypothetical protein
MKKLFAMMVLALLPWTAVQAAKVASLYEAEVAVASQADDMRAQAVQEGFLQVLIRASGDPQIDRNPLIKESLQRSDYYVQEFSYSAATVASSQYTLHVRYNEADVKRLLRRAGVVHWGENRPLLMVWLAVTNKQNDTDIIASESSGDMYSTMKQQSTQFGLPMIFPLMDVDDVNRVSVDDISNMAVSVLQDAAKRYAPDGILIGKIDESGEEVESQWELVIKQDQWNWEINDKTPEAVVSSIMDEISQTLAKHYAAKSSNKLTKTWVS